MKKKFSVVKNFRIVKRSCSLNRYYGVGRKFCFVKRWVNSTLLLLPDGNFKNTTHYFLKDLVFITFGKTDDVPKNMDRKFLSWPWGCILRPFLNV